MNHPVTRRSVAKGTVWSIPAVAVASAAPALAASGASASASCTDFSNNCSGGTYRGHLSGRTINGGNLYIYHGFTAGSTAIPSGTVFTRTDTLYVQSSDVSTQLGIQATPNTQSDTYGTWSTSKITSGSTTTLGGVNYTAMNYTVTYTLSQAVPAGGSICSYVVTTPAYIRANIAYPGITISNMTMSAGTVTNGGAYSSGQISTTAGQNASSASRL